jgi:DNA polymerase (family X)
MTPQEVAGTLREIAQLLLLKGENSFKVRAYETGAEAFEALPPDPSAPNGLLARVRAGTLGELSGVGKAIDQKVSELVTTGKLGYLDDLRKQFPPGALDLVRVPGVGPKKALALIEQLDVGSLEDLERVCAEGKVRALKGFGEKSEKQILEGLHKLRERTVRRPLGQTRPAAETLLALVRGSPGVREAAIAGSVRRYAETSGDVDLVAALAEGALPGPVMEAFCAAPNVADVIGRGDTKSSVRLKNPQGLQADLRVVGAGRFATALHHFTGSKAHHVRLRGLARTLGLSISEYSLARIDPSLGPPLEVRDEAELYRHLGLPFIAPEMREDRGELEAARDGRLPDLIDAGSVQGFVHCHTTWSDGRSTIEELAQAALAAGKRYLTITDHTQAAGYANGLTAERLVEQQDEISRVQAKLPGVRLLRGCEVDILEDGALDLPDAVLEKLDLVICSVHQRFKLDQEQQTARLRRAISHPLCRIWGHPTGRRVGDRDQVSARWEDLFALCAERGVAVECNGTPERLDLPADLLRIAVERGCKVSISVDAHSAEQLAGNLPWAIGTARRGWVDKASVVNARGADEFLAMLSKR